MNRRLFVASGLAAGIGIASAAAQPRDGYFVPAEDAPHAFCFMQWPVNLAIYQGERWFLEKVQRTIALIANTIAAFEPVVMLAAADHHHAARRLLGDGVTLWNIPTDDLWARDSGPIVVRDAAGRRAVRHIRFNGWGNKQPHRQDGRVAERAAAMLGMPLLPTPLRGEAGGVEQDGHGLLMAHESSWIIENRNPGMNRKQVEAALLDAYGADRMIWAPGLAGEDITDYHIDSLARFTAPGRVLMTLPSRPQRRDPFHATALETRARLREAGLDVEAIDEPVRHRVQDPAFLASYANFYVCNGAVIAQEFGDAEADHFAALRLRHHFPGREIVQMNADALGYVGGGIHCATHQVPAV